MTVFSAPLEAVYNVLDFYMEECFLKRDLLFKKQCLSTPDEPQFLKNRTWEPFFSINFYASCCYQGVRGAFIEFVKWLLLSFTFVFTRLHEARSGDICNACVLLVKRWKKLPAGSKKNWNHVSNLFLLHPKINLSLLQSVLLEKRGGAVLARIWDLLFAPHLPFPPPASLNPSWSISCYVTLTCLSLA